MLNRTLSKIVPGSRNPLGEVRGEVRAESSSRVGAESDSTSQARTTFPARLDNLSDRAALFPGESIPPLPARSDLSTLPASPPLASQGAETVAETVAEVVRRLRTGRRAGRVRRPGRAGNRERFFLSSLRAARKPFRRLAMYTATLDDLAARCPRCRKPALIAVRFPKGDPAGQLICRTCAAEVGR